MVKTFEEQTAPLKKYERDFAWHIIDTLVKSPKPVKEPSLIESVSKSTHIPLSGVRLRKLVNFIRLNSIAPIMASRRGYFISNNKDVILANIESLRERANAINAAANGLAKFVLNEKIDVQTRPKT